MASETERAIITREKFIAATGREPRHDDLERCNCPLAGEFGHWFCGWNVEQNRPQFEVGAHIGPQPEPGTTAPE